MDEQIGVLIRLGYQVGLAQDHSDDPETEVNHVYAVNGFGVQTHVADEATMRNLVESHDERIAAMRAEDERRLQEARNSAE